MDFVDTNGGSYREYTLDNGLVVALQETPTQTTFGKLIVNYGSLHEQPGEEGLAHFLEHVMCTGGAGSIDPEEAAAIMDSVGMFNASTSLDFTNIRADMLGEDLPRFLEFAAEAAFNPRLDPDKIEMERQRVVSEIADYNASDDNYHKEFRRALVGDHPMHSSVIGEAEVVRYASQDDLRSFHERGYNASNMTLILVGKLPKDVDDLVLEYFGDRPAGPNTKYEFPTPRELTEKVELFRTKTSNTTGVNGEAESGELYVGFQVPSMQFEQSTELQILANLLGGSSASRLFKGISERQGLVYGISCGYDGLYGQGSFQIATSARPENMDAIMDGVFREMSTLRNELVPQRELDVLVRNGRYAMGKGFETNEGREQIIEGRLFYGWDSVAKMGRWGSVTPQDILELSREHLPASREDGNYVVLAKTPK